MYEDVVAIDTDVLVIHHIYTHDHRYDVNERFLREVRKNYRIGLTIHNLLELYGIASLVWTKEKALSLYETYLRAKDVVILYPSMPLDWTSYIEKVSTYIAKGLHYGDSLIAWTLDDVSPRCFVTWNTKHFKGKINIEVLTPSEFLSKFTE